MKKALAIFMIFALVASVAFAEITFGAWGRTMFVPIANSGADNVEMGSKIVPSWDWGGPDGIGAGGGRIGATIAGNSDNVGFQIDFNGDGGSINGGDEQKVWVKPMDMLKISVGRVQVDALRGNAAFGSWNWYRAYGDDATGEDFTFSRMSTGIGGDATNNNRQGVVFEVAPMDALWVGLALRDVNATWENGTKEWEQYFTGPNKPNTANLLAKMQFAIGYTIDGIGQFKAQIIRNPYEFKANGDANKNNDTVEIAFNLTMVENLFVEAGFRMFTESDANMAKTVSLYGKYNMDALTIHMSTQIDLNEKKGTLDGKGDMGLYVGAGVDYDLGDGLAVAGDVRFTNAVKADNFDWTKMEYSDSVITVFAGVTKGFSNGLIGAGVEIASSGDTGYAIPVRFEYWF